MQIRGIIRRFIRDEGGMEVVEYAVLAGLITLAAVATILTVGLLAHGKMVRIEEHLSGN